MGGAAGRGVAPVGGRPGVFCRAGGGGGGGAGRGVPPGAGAATGIFGGVTRNAGVPAPVIAEGGRLVGLGGGGGGGGGRGGGAAGFAAAGAGGCGGRGGLGASAMGFCES
ncbi:MAG: hypothetical protein JST54_16000 [Deltaproteobacteria bacterium]|nr:hypothetical protein [Deltaproteobacteria bacterium]